MGKSIENRHLQNTLRADPLAILETRHYKYEYTYSKLYTFICTRVFSYVYGIYYVYEYMYSTPTKNVSYSYLFVNIIELYMNIASIDLNLY